MLGTATCAYVDESIGMRGPAHQEYLLCAALVPDGARDLCREALRKLLKPGQIKWHWTDESSARKQEMIDVIASFDSLNVLVAHLDSRRRKVDRYRRKCLQTLYRECAGLAVRELVLESRSPVQDRQDVAHLVALRQSGADASLRIDHRRGGDEPLLWIPDAVAGAANAHAKGQLHYLEQLRTSVLIEARTPESLEPENDEGP